MKFEDHFSDRAELYATFRPRYPKALFTFVASLCARHERALDCGTGNGQAAIELAEHFESVVGIDASEAQISNATPHPSIQYRVARADQTGLPAQSIDLVISAQALHWFDIPRFFDEAKRVLRGDGAIAIWGYGDPLLDTGALQALLHQFNRGKLESYWPAERQLLLDGYRTVEFPFAECESPPFEIRVQWTLPQLVGYLRSWSATARYLKQHGTDPVTALEPALRAEWGNDDETRLVRWPLYVRAGKVRHS